MSSSAVQRSTLPRRLLAAITTSAIAGVLSLAAIAPASAAIVTSTPSQIAAALAGPGAVVTGAGYVSNVNPAAGGVADSALSAFPTDGSSFAILSTGRADSADDANTNFPDSSGATDDKSTNFGGGPVRGNTDRDVTVLKIDLDVPATANCLSFDFQFLSEEYNEFVGQAFNDAFIAELDSSTWTTVDTAINAPDNFAFDSANNVVSVNSVGLGGFSRANAGNTTYDGATPLLSAARQVTPGAHSLYLSVFDQGDNILDSAAFVDNLRVGFVPDPATQCVPGAQVKLFDLSLSPATDTLSTGSTHTVTATLTDVNSGLPQVGGSIVFAASGANTSSGTDVTDASGQATHSYTGTNVGSDTIAACYDVGGDGTCDAGDPFASAAVEWTNSPPVNDAQGPYAGDEGSAIAVVGTASDVDGDSLTHTWSASPVSGVDAGATCSFGDASALSTAVTCTDDGVYELSLASADGVNPPTTDTAQLTVGNVAPEITSVNGPSAPVAIGTPVTVTGSYTDAGANDSHTASLTWDDGTTTTPPAAGGSVSGSHTYTAAGIYTVCLTVTDDDLGSDQECAANYVVVYDPSAGFVTGGGSIDAAAGSFPADPSVSGPGRFGFVAKYQKGKSTPSGNTEFQFQAGDLNFHSDAYEWLVIAGSKAIYKGTGTVNGESGYEFQVSTVDGGPGGVDRFRIKITNSGGVVFDNQMGAADDASAATAITRGSIVIHN